MNRRLRYRLERKKQFDLTPQSTELKEFLDRLGAALGSRVVSFNSVVGTAYPGTVLVGATWKDVQNPGVVGDAFVQRTGDGVFSGGLAATREADEDIEETEFAESATPEELAGLWVQLADRVGQRNGEG